MRLPILALAVTLAACQPAASQVRAFAAQTGQIINANTPTAVCMHTPAHDARWTPVQSNLAELDPVLIELIEYRLDEQNLTYEDTAEMQPELYHRNYYGFEQQGWRYILVCGRYGQEPTRFFDGGPSQFAAIYDTRRKLFTWFEFGYRA